MYEAKAIKYEINIERIGVFKPVVPILTKSGRNFKL